MMRLSNMTMASIAVLVILIAATITVVIVLVTKGKQDGDAGCYRNGSSQQADGKGGKEGRCLSDTTATKNLTQCILNSAFRNKGSGNSLELIAQDCFGHPEPTAGSGQAHITTSHANPNCKSKTGCCVYFDKDPGTAYLASADICQGKTDGQPVNDVVVKKQTNGTSVCVKRGKNQASACNASFQEAINGLWDPKFNVSKLKNVPCYKECTSGGSNNECSACINCQCCGIDYDEAMDVA